MSNFGERAWIEPDSPEPDYQAELAAAYQELDRLRAALERAANDLMLSEESFVKMRDKRDDVLRKLHAAEAALERLTAAASGRGMVSEMDGLPEIAVLVVGLHERAEKAEAALEQARALAGEWRKYSIDTRIDPPTRAAYGFCADELAAALGLGGAA